jgi:hypothetical protein
MVIKDIKNLTFKGLPKCTKTGGLVTKINHLATLLSIGDSFFCAVGV